MWEVKAQWQCCCTFFPSLEFLCEFLHCHFSGHNIRDGHIEVCKNDLVTWILFCLSNDILGFPHCDPGKSRWTLNHQFGFLNRDLHPFPAWQICLSDLSFVFLVHNWCHCFVFHCSNFNLMTTIAHCLLILFFGVPKSQFCTALTSDQALSWIWICCLMNCISVLAAAQSVGMPISISSSSESSCQCSQRQFSSRLNSNCCFLVLNCACFTTCSSHSHISIALSRTAFSSFKSSVCV